MNDSLSADYVEPARSYRSVWLLAGFLIVGFGVDLWLGSAIVHLPGWILAAVLVLGIDLLVIYAARSTRSLRVDAHELHVGDEAIGRAEIVAVAPEVDDSLPVLGWTTGMPRSMKGITVRLFDGQNLVIPTRFPQRLQTALGLAVDDGQDVRPAEQADLPRLADIDTRAGAVFRMAGYELPDIPFPDDVLATAKAIFVVGRPPVAFVRVDEVDGLAHIEEIAVVPKRMRQGIAPGCWNRPAGGPRSAATRPSR